MKLIQSSLYVLAIVIIIQPTRCFTTTRIYSKKKAAPKVPLAKNSEDASNKKEQKKRRRFAQDVEPIVEISRPSDIQRPLHPIKMTTRERSNDSNGKIADNLHTISNKSIEELENIMSKRWGTSEDKWTANFDEWEIVEEEENKSGDSRQGRESLVSGRRLKSRPVLDPWEKEELRRKYKRIDEDTDNDDKNSQGDVKSGSNGNSASVFQSDANGLDAVLERVKKNQERFQSKNAQKREKNTPSEVESVRLVIDGEGFTVPGQSDYIDHDENMGRSRYSKTGRDSSGPTFFFKEQADDITLISQSHGERIQKEKSKEEPVVEKKEKKAKKNVKGMVDDKGNELILTLDQAKRNVDAFIGPENENAYERSSTKSWEDIGITHSVLLQNLARMGCGSPLSVQDRACPEVVGGNDLLISTHTGSGKTLAFLTPLAEQLLGDDDGDDKTRSAGVKVIVIAPGRELASQIVDVARNLFQGTHLKATLAIGGTPFGRNFENIRKGKPQFIVGTPGRIAELVVGKPGEKGGKLKLNDLQAIVLDECDALLEYEPHREPTTATLNLLKKRHNKSLQCILCSATAGDLMGKSLIEELLRPGYAHAQSDNHDELITKGDTSKMTRVSRTVIHGVVRVDHQRFALDALRRVLYTDPAPQQVLIFVDNARRVGVVVDKLAQLGIIAAPLHGGQGSEKGDRAEVNKGLREGFIGIVVATEMAARGIDAPYLTHVINLDLPTDASHYAHRAGRCGRGGRPGVVVNIAVGSKEKNVPTKFANALGIDMYLAEPLGGKLVILDKVVDGTGKEGMV